MPVLNVNLSTLYVYVAGEAACSIIVLSLSDPDQSLISCKWPLNLFVDPITAPFDNVIVGVKLAVVPNLIVSIDAVGNI